jgi:hypothetical protein
VEAALLHMQLPASFTVIEAIRIAIDECVERETGNRKFFLDSASKHRLIGRKHLQFPVGWGLPWLQLPKNRDLR